MKYICLAILCLSVCLSAEESFSDRWLKNQLAKEVIIQKIRFLNADLAAIRTNTASAAESIVDMEVLKKQLLRNANIEKEDKHALEIWNRVYALIVKDEQEMTKMAVDEYFKRADVETPVEKGK